MKTFFVSTLLTVVLLALAIPSLMGWLARSQLNSAIDRLPASEALSLRVTDRRGGWLQSELLLALSGEPFENLQVDGEPVPLLLELNHGPLVWNLVDSPFALAHLQLHPADDYTGAAQGRLSGSGLLQLGRDWRMRWSSILGLPAFDGDHTLQVRADWPARDTIAGWRQLSETLRLDLSIDADAPALLNSPAEEAVRIYEQQGWIRYSQGRALTYISINEGWVDINGQVFPLANLLGAP